MTDRPSDSESHDRVAAAYRKISTERAAERLDRVVLEQAARELDRDKWFRRSIPWFRPAAFAATAGLSLAIVLELVDTGSGPLEGPASDTVIEGFESAAEGATTRLREIGAAASESSLPSESVADLGADLSEVIGQDLYRIENALERYRIDNARYPTAAQGLEALISKPADVSAGTWLGPYLDRLPIDPWSNPYQYRIPGNHAAVDVFTLGRDGVSGGVGPDADRGTWNVATTF